jgi:hypothetical protein
MRCPPGQRCYHRWLVPFYGLRDYSIVWQAIGCADLCWLFRCGKDCYFSTLYVYFIHEAARGEHVTGGMWSPRRQNRWSAAGWENLLKVI